MSPPPPPGRVQPCERHDALARLHDAQAQLALAELVSVDSSPEELKAATSCAVLAGIAASDAACCAALGQRSRARDHRDATALLRGLADGGADAAKQLARLLQRKDQSQYGFVAIGDRQHLAALRQARALVAFAEQVLRP